VVLATNIAETSLTIEGIRLVVDSAQERGQL
jgi:ATP-dependent helicase HrpB